MVRPAVPISAEQVVKLAAYGMKTKEIADLFGVSDDTITRRYAAELKQGRAMKAESLRRTQMRLAIEKENVQMLIWLGKQYLGQTEKQEIEHSNAPLESVESEEKRYIDVIATVQDRKSLA